MADFVDKVAAESRVPSNGLLAWRADLSLPTSPRRGVGRYALPH